MRTSRIAHDTSRILAATRRQPLRRTRAATNTLNAVEAGGVAKGATHESKSAVFNNRAESSASDLSSPPSHVHSDADEVPVSRKRKRKEAAPVAVKREVNEVDVTPKRETKPKKARRVPAKRITGKDGENNTPIVHVMR